MQLSVDRVLVNVSIVLSSRVKIEDKIIENVKKILKEANIMNVLSKNINLKVIGDNTEVYGVELLFKNYRKYSIRSLKKMVLAFLTKYQLDYVIRDSDIVSNYKLMLSDLDGTAIEAISSLIYFNYVSDTHKLEDIVLKANRGEISYIDSYKERLDLVKGSNIASYRERVLSEMISNVSSGIGAVVNGLRTHGVKTCLLSASFEYFVKDFADYMGFSHSFGTRVEIIDGILTGKLLSNPLDSYAKYKIMLHLMELYKVPLNKVIAIGDGNNDLGIVGQAGLGIAYKAKDKKLEELAVGVIKYTSYLSLLMFSIKL